MKNTNKIKILKEYWWLITTIIGVIAVLFIQSITIYDSLRLTQQMALKSVIWNKEIPITERATACDAYIDAGYNSLTKKECEILVEKGADKSIFSYIER